MTPKEFKEGYRNGPYAWPGGYPQYLVMRDGGSLCCGCVVKERRLILQAARLPERFDDEWGPVGFDVNWEDAELYCDNCGTRIESAYAEPES